MELLCPHCHEPLVAAVRMHAEGGSVEILEVQLNKTEEDDGTQESD